MDKVRRFANELLDGQTTEYVKTPAKMAERLTNLTSGSDLLISTDDGLYCPEGGFHIDPWKVVERAVVTHAHSDHVTAGCGSYLCSTSGRRVLRERLGKEATISGEDFGTMIRMRGVRVSLHPAGHILGSAQVRVERRVANGGGVRKGEVWVFSGDYKIESDLTCQAFEPVPCDVFITESTFGLPIYRWGRTSDEFGRVNAWWRANAAQERTSVLFAYALGKAQRLLAGIDPAIGPIAVHGAIDRFNKAYRDEGVSLPDAPHAIGETVSLVRGRGLLIAPPSALGSPWIRKFASTEQGFSAAVASGWMQVRGTRRRKAVDRGFVVSDHADWPGLLQAIKATGATRVGITHGYVRQFAQWLSESGYDTFALPTRYEGEREDDGAGSNLGEQESVPDLVEPNAPSLLRPDAEK